MAILRLQHEWVPGACAPGTTLSTALRQRCRLPRRSAEERDELVERCHQLLDLAGQLAEQAVRVEQVRHPAEQVTEQPLALIGREVKDDRLREVGTAPESDS